MKKDVLETWVNEHLPVFIQKLISLARTDLYDGPLRDVYIWTAGHSPAPNKKWVLEGDYEDSELNGYTEFSFQWAIQEIKKAWDLPYEVFLDTQCDVIVESLPEPEQDEETGEWHEPEYGDYKCINVKREYLGVVSPFN